MPLPSILDPRGRITIRPEYRRLLSGPVQQLETEEGILLRPAPSPQEANDPRERQAEGAQAPSDADVA